MRSVTIYATPFCGYCSAAKRLLRDRGADFTEVDLHSEPQRRAEMIDRARGRTTVPQIFIGDDHVGGFDDLYALDRDGRLAPLLGGG